MPIAPTACVSMREFLRSGEFGPVRLGDAVDSLRSAFGKPHDVGGTSRRHRAPRIWYEYQVEGRRYRSSTYCFGVHVERAEAAFLIGSKVRVYYDPKDPQRAVLKRGLQPSMILGP